jgi:hypothetical protein
MAQSVSPTKAPVPATTASTTTTRTGLLPETASIKTCIAQQHDWSDLRLQYHLATYTTTSAKSDLLATVLEKIKGQVGSSFTNYWGNQAAWHRYDALASVIGCSSYTRSEDFVHCGDGTFACQDRLLCPKCCYNRLARRVLEEFGNAFTADSEVHYIVTSLSHDPDETNRLKVTDIGEDELHVLKHRVVSAQHGTVDGELDYGVGFGGYDELLQCRLLWYFMAEAIQEFTGGQRGSLFNGAFGGPELAVQFSPLRALPHANYLCWSPGFSIDGARELRRFIRTKMRDCRLIEPGLYPSVACYRLRTADDLRRVVNYIFKPIDLASAYVRAAELVDYVPVDMACLNLEVNKFLKNAQDVFWNLRRVARYGRCHASHHDYIGEVSAYRLAQREAAAERRAGGGAHDRTSRAGSDLDPVARWELHYNEQFERPTWPTRPRASRYQLWRQLNHEQVSPAPYPVHS